MLFDRIGEVLVDFAKCCLIFFCWMIDLYFYSDLYLYLRLHHDNNYYWSITSFNYLFIVVSLG